VVEASGSHAKSFCKFNPMSSSQQPLQRIAPAVKLGGRQRMTCGQNDCTPWFFLTWEVEPRARIFFEPGSGCRQEQNPKWGEHPIADTPLPSLLSQHETQTLLPGPKPKTGRGFTANCGGGLKPKRN